MLEMLYKNKKIVLNFSYQENPYLLDLQHKVSELSL